MDDGAVQISQVISLRNRDHVNLSKLSGHSLAHIIAHDILPYIASYVVMALILQFLLQFWLKSLIINSWFRGQEPLMSPHSEVMMNWAMIMRAHILNKWWAYFPVLVAIA